MPADPKVNPLEAFGAMFANAVDNDGWWNYIEQERISWGGDRYSSAASGLFFKAARSGKQLHEFSTNGGIFKASSEKISDNKKVVGSFVKEIANLGLNICYNLKYSKDDGGNYNRLFTDNQSVISILITSKKDDKRIDIMAASFDEKLIDKVRALVLKYIEFNPNEPELFIICESEDGLILRGIGKPGIALESGNYNVGVIDGFKYTVEQLSKKDPFGRLVIMHGPPGTGKTHLLKSLIQEMDLDNRKFIFLQPEFLYRFNIATLTRIFLDAAENGNSLVLIIEDADDCLVPRQADNMVAISTLLNFADGFIGNMLDIRIVATTNAKELNIDAALKRPGRLCRIIGVDKLEVDIANKVYQRLSKSDESPFDKRVPLAEVYELAYKPNGVTSNENTFEASKGVGFIK